MIITCLIGGYLVPGHLVLRNLRQRLIERGDLGRGRFLVLQPCHRSAPAVASCWASDNSLSLRAYSEVCGFRWEGADLEVPYTDPGTGEPRMGAVLTVKRTILQLGGKLHEEETAKTKAGDRLVFLEGGTDDEPGTADLLRMHRKAQLRARMAAGPAWQDNDLVFCRPDGRPWNPDNVSKRFKRLAAGAGVPVIKLHEGGRHTGNSMMYDAEVRQDITMRQVGHASAEISQRYNHPLRQAHLAAAGQVAALVRKAGGAS
jgi:hypothetical protein